MTADVLTRPTGNPWALPAGRVVLPADAPRDRWLAARAQGIGGSDAPVLLGLANHGTPFEVWASKVGVAGPDVRTEPMRRGNWLEPHIADWFAERTGIECRRMGLVRSHELPWLQYTPDRVGADGSVVEIKSVGQWAEVRHEWAAGAAGHAWAQLQHGLLVTGRSHGWLAAYVIDRPPMMRGPFPRDEEFLAVLRDRLTRWWAGHVLTRQPPPVDLDTATDDEVITRWGTVDKDTTREAEWPAAVRALLAERAELSATEAAGRAAEKRRREVDLALKVMAAGAGALTINGEPAVLFRDQVAGGPRVAPELYDDHPELAAQYLSRTTTRRVYLPTPAKPRRRKRGNA